MVLRLLRRRGFSLLELMLAMVLLLLLLALMFNFLIPTLRAATRGEVMVEMEQEATNALQKICNDLGQSAAGGVSLNSNVYSYVAANECPALPVTPPSPPIAMSIQTLDQVCSQYNSQVWDTNFLALYYWDTAGDLTRRYFKLGTDGICLPNNPADVPGQITPCQLCILGIDASLKPVEVLATNVTWFSVAYPTALSKNLCPATIKTQCGYPATPLTVTISLYRVAATGNRTNLTSTFSRTMSVREQSTADICIPTSSPAKKGCCDE